MRHKQSLFGWGAHHHSKAPSGENTCSTHKRNYPHVAVPDSALNQARTDRGRTENRPKREKDSKKPEGFLPSGSERIVQRAYGHSGNASFEGLPYDVTLNNQ